MKTRTALSIALLSLSLAACGADATDDHDEASDDADATYYSEAADGDKADAVRAGRFEIFAGRDGKSYFHLLAGNGEKVLASQGYATVRGAELGVDSVRRNGAAAAAYRLLESRDGQWYGNLLAANGQIIATSELYATRANAERGISAIASGLEAASRHQLGASRARFQVFRGLDGRYYFHLRAGNGEIMLQSQAYTRRASAVGGTSSVRDHGASPARYVVKDAADGQAYFVLTAVNGQVIAVSELYATRSNAARAVETAAALLEATPVQDAS